MRLLFPADYWNALAPDVAYEVEVEAASKVHLDFSLVKSDALIEQQNIGRAIRRVESAAAKEIAVYRGWMLKPQVYEQLYEALAAKNLLLINSPAAYKYCHYLPASYPLIQAMTPKSVWLQTNAAVPMEQIMALLKPFGERPVIVKDYVKSRKHEWNEACYIPSAADREAVQRVVARFLQLQGEDLNEGLVFREFVEFEPLTTHSKSEMPLVKEFRLFVLDGQIISTTPYWEEGDYGQGTSEEPPLAQFSHVVQSIQSRFFSMDVARKRDGGWNIVELGDGQVAGLPGRMGVDAFYQTLVNKVG